MHKIALLALTLAACGGSTVATTHYNDDAEPPTVDASHADAYHDAQGVSDASPDADAPAEADAGGLLCCSTNGGQNLLACDPSAPWMCGDSPTHPGACTDATCAAGDACQGFNGPGTVVVCGQ